MSVLLAPFALIRLLAQSVLLALGQVKERKLRSLLTATGIIIGVASVTAVIAGLTGLRAKVLADFETIGTRKISISAMWPDSGPMRRASRQRIRLLPKQFEDFAANCPSVAALMKLCWLDGVVRRGERRLATPQLLGTSATSESVQNRTLLLGRRFTPVDEAQRRKVCIITSNVIDALRLDRDCIGQKLLIGNSTFTIVGVLEPPESTDLFSGQNGAPMGVYVPFSAAYRPDSWMNVDALAKSAEAAPEAVAEISFFLRRARGIKPGEPDTFRVATMQRALDQFNQISAAVTAIASGIVGISLLVGGIGIMNIMLVSVSERTREIGLRKAVGARPSGIMLQFLIEAVMLCLAGGLVGVAAGYVLTQAIAHIPGAQLEKAYVPFWAIELAFGFSTVIGLVFGVFPAIKAARMDPIEALRHE